MAVISLVLLVMVVSVVYAMVRANREDLWRLLPGALAPLALQITVILGWMYASDDSYAALGAMIMALLFLPLTLVANTWLCLRKHPLGAWRVLGEGVAVAVAVPLVVALGLFLFRGLLGH